MTLIEETPSCGVGDVGELYGSLAPRLEQIVRLDVRASDAVIEDACQFAWCRLLHHSHRVHRETVMAWLARTAVHEAFKLLRRDRRELSLDVALEDGARARGRPRHADAPGATRAPRADPRGISAAGASTARRVATCSRAQLRRDGGARRLHEADGRPPAPAGEASDPRRVAIELKRRLRRGRAAEASPTGPGRAYAGASPPGSACAAWAAAWSRPACPRRRSEPACGGPSGRAGARRAR